VTHTHTDTHPPTRTPAHTHSSPSRGPPRRRILQPMLQDIQLQPMPLVLRLTVMRRPSLPPALTARSVTSSFLRLYIRAHRYVGSNALTYPCRRCRHPLVNWSLVLFALYNLDLDLKQPIIYSMCVLYDRDLSACPAAGARMEVVCSLQWPCVCPNRHLPHAPPHPRPTAATIQPGHPPHRLSESFRCPDTGLRRKRDNTKLGLWLCSLQ
jgi:hypothetical protein